MIQFLIKYFYVLKFLFQNVANITTDFFKELKKEKVKRNEINLLLATQELESFAIEYSKIHFKANESKVISQEHYCK